MTVIFHTLFCDLFCIVLGYNQDLINLTNNCAVM